MIKRFKATQLNGKWYVGQGHKTYYPTTECDTKQEAERQALVWMVRDAYNLSRELYDQGVEKGLLDDDCFFDYLA